MPVIAWYVLKLSVSLCVVYLFYQLVLRRLTFYTWNRWYLLGYSLLAFGIPFVNIHPLLEKHEWTDAPLVAFVPVIDHLTAAAPVVASRYDAWDVWWCILIAGVLITGLRLLLQYISFRHMRRSAQLITAAPVKVYQINRPIVPFSFGRSVFINRHQHREDELKKIISHEFIHVKQKHTIDILWAEVLCMLNWYNPFAWLLRRSIRQNLEFIADNHVIGTGIDKKEYQYLLLKVVGMPSFSITPQFNIVSLKKRIAMMNKIRSAKIHLFRFLFVLPLAAVLLLAFRNSQHTDMPTPLSAALPDYVVELAKDTVPKVKEVVKYDVVVVKRSPYNKKGYRITVADNAGECVVIVKDKKENIVKAIQLTEWNKNKAHYENLYGEIPPAPVEMPKEKVVIKADSIVIVGDRELQIDASKDGPGNPAIRIRGADENNVLFVVDGKIVSREKFDAIPPEDIESVTVLKNSSAEALYGAKGKYGVIEVTTRRGKSRPIVIEESTPDVAPEIVGKVFNGLYVLDGKAYNEAAFKELKIDPDDIETITYIKGKDAVSSYGAKGAGGIYYIKLKKEAAPDKSSFHMTAAMRTKIRDYAQAHGIVYVGVGNLVQVKAPGIPQHQLEVEVDKGTVQKTDSGFIIRPDRPGETLMNIYQADGRGGRALVETRHYAARFLPPPQELAKLFE